MTKDEQLKSIWDAGLTDQEYCIIGHIVAQWGALESEVFIQTLFSFGDEVNINNLPKEMNNLNFTAVLKLWKKRVVDNTPDEKRNVLESAYEKILEYKDIRNSIVHGMWDFSLREPNTISTMRVKKDQIISAKFEDGYLSDYSLNLAEINMNIRYPGGMEEMFMERAESGFYVNEAALRRMKIDSKK